MKYFLHLAYKGTNYKGWQRQKNSIGIQAVLEDQLSRMFHQKILLHGCGRTDAGVHASQYFCHTIIEKTWNFDAVFRINKMLPSDIRVYEFIPVPDFANAQLDVLSRTYDYYIHLQEDPFLADLSTFYLIENPNIAEMQAAVQLLLKYQDYRSFCRQPNLYKTTNCAISFAELQVVKDENRLRFRITANRFLRAMVRLIVGNLIAIGKGSMRVAEFESLLKNPQPMKTAHFAYPQGLYLSQIIYPYKL